MVAINTNVDDNFKRETGTDIITPKAETIKEAENGHKIITI